MNQATEEPNGQMTISIIIPALNEGDRIASLIDELRNRESSDGYIHEIVVADGGSSDSTRKNAELAGANVLACRRRGRAAQMNEGAEVSSGNILYFLHADTIPPTDFDRHIADAVREGAGAGCFQLRFSSDHRLLQFYGWCTRFRSTLVRFGDQSLFVTSGNFRKIGGFDESLAMMEDQQIVGNLKKITPFTLLDKAVETSARKYEKNGVIRLQFIFGVIVILYYVGARQDTLVHLYKSLVKL